MPSDIQEEVEEFLDFHQGTYTPRDHPEGEFAFEATRGDINFLIWSPEDREILFIEVPMNLNSEQVQQLESRFGRPQDRREFFRELQRQLIDRNQSFVIETDDNNRLQGWVTRRKRIVTEDIPEWQKIEDDIQNVINTHIRAITYLQEFTSDIGPDTEDTSTGSDMPHIG